jgi:hypothetical protein
MGRNTGAGDQRRTRTLEVRGTSVTTREHFKLIAKRSQYILVAVMMIAALCLVVWREHLPTWLTPTLSGVAIAVVLLPIWLAIGHFVFRCPRCNAFLNFKGQTPSRPYNGPGTIWDRWDRCPKCQVSFDEPYRH